MSTNQQVRDAWAAQVFANIAGGVTSYDYDLWTRSSSEDGKGLYQGAVDFWIYHVRHANQYIEIGRPQAERRFQVEVVRVKEHSPEILGIKTVSDDLEETLFDLVETNLGKTWAGTVDFWQPPSEVTVPEEREFAGRRAYEARVIYTATKGM